MQVLHRFAGSIQRYSEELSDPDHHRPDRCPQCETHRPLRAHGFYTRKLVGTGFDGAIRVRRHLCCCCKRTVSPPPEFALNRELAIQGIMARIQKCGGNWPGTCSCWLPARVYLYIM
jgi:hypothetical protein